MADYFGFRDALRFKIRSFVKTKLWHGTLCSHNVNAILLSRYLQVLGLCGIEGKHDIIRLHSNHFVAASQQLIVCVSNRFMALLIGFTILTAAWL